MRLSKRWLMSDISLMAIEALTPNRRNARTHSRQQIRQIADSITAFGFVVPILVDENGIIIAGHGRYAAAKLLALREVPTIRVSGLSAGKRRALALADNRIAESAGWDRAILAAELPELSGLLVVEGLDLSITGFPQIEIAKLTVLSEEDSAHSAPAPSDGKVPVSEAGDVWQLGRHRLICADASKPDDLVPVDVAIKRWHVCSRRDAVHVE